MDIAALAGPAALAIAGVLVLLAIASVLIKCVRDRAAARRAARARALRPHVIALAGGGERAEDAAGALDAARRDDVRVTALEVLPLLRGADRAALVRALELRGVVDAARRDTYSRHGLTRATAAEILGGCGVGRSLPELGRLLRDRDREVRIVAARAMGKLGGPGAVPFLLASLEEPRPVPTSIVGMALTRVGPQATDGLREGLRGTSAPARSLSALLLGRLGAAAAADELIDALADPEPAVRAAAAEALGRIGLPRAAGAVAALMDDPSPEVRRAATVALGGLGAADAAPALADVLDAGASGAAWDAARSLGQIGAAGRRALNDRAHRDDPTGGYAREALAATR